MSLGTDGFGRSDNREYLRRHFENDAESIAAAAIAKLARDGKFDGKKAKKAIVGARDRSGKEKSRSRVMIQDQFRALLPRAREVTWISRPAN